MQEISLELCEPEHVKELAERCIPADRVEMLAMGMDPVAGLRATLRNSIEAYTARWDGELACCFGVVRQGELTESYHPWLISTPVIYQHPRVFLNWSKMFVASWEADYPRLTNYVDVRHTRAIKWLRWLGASFEPIDQFGPYKRPFLKFTLGDSYVR